MNLARDAALAGEVRPLDGARILVVDDNQPVRFVVRRYLERAAATCVEAEDGNQALAVLATEAFDLVVLDIDMPGLNGIDTCLQLRANPTTARLPVVFLTGRDDEMRHVQALQAGGDDFITKPFTAPVLIARIANLVARHRAERENTRLVELLRRYVSVPLRAGEAGRQAVERVDATVLFSDLRGFTATSMHESAEHVFSAISDVLAEQTRIVTKWHGYVDKFSGDGMLAIFEGADSAHDACRAAMDIVSWARAFAGISFWQPPPIGFGIHKGEFLRGDLGGENQLEFTVIGAPVNIAARLCGVARALEIVVSEDIARRVEGRVRLSSPRLVPLKGLSEAASLHTVLVP
ncbi:MAG: adenylate/guanylate cyclase domain-containing response regulator [Myxococcales bacterium]|nr:adenylate/guanylate cyclase domain-containing response regulator [Myxococcales bacterium]